MTNILIVFALTVLPWLVALIFHSNLEVGGRIGISVMFLFAAPGHFFKTDSMMAMLPTFVPLRRAAIYLSGFVEIAFAVAVVMLPNLFYVGVGIMIYLAAIFPSNIYAAVHRIPFGRHSLGPRYLFVRLPLQLFLIFWTYWFAVRGH